MFHELVKDPYKGRCQLEGVSQDVFFHPQPLNREREIELEWEAVYATKKMMYLGTQDVLGVF